MKFEFTIIALACLSSALPVTYNRQKVTNRSAFKQTTQRMIVDGTGLPPPYYKLMSSNETYVNGYNVKKIEAQMSTFEELSYGQWTETYGDQLFTYVEDGRDEDAVYLRDVENNLIAIITVYSQQVYFFNQFIEFSDTIIESYRYEFGYAQEMEKGVNGNNVIKIETDDSTFYQLSSDTWVQNLYETMFNVTSRDEASLHLIEEDGEFTVDFDMSALVQTVNLEFRQETYEITGAYRWSTSYDEVKK
jgi:hypothetical protein